ncbi:hypothetical protein MIMGU_mgv1a020932mg [Erythranthe guttata]|uniref:Auxin response factor n=1 Tax=Erythranthe guttata TaxID=4155 RepID=A0A022RHG8_ERYGU|nr:hypothetical protein MIMGU_mgv1a020932mg [Erythranthe guttata]
MINVMHSVVNQLEKSLNPQLWHACAGGMAQTPPLNSGVYYFPQGHAEHAAGNLDSGEFSKIPPLVLCRVLSVKYLADAESDEVFAKIKLVPLGANDEFDSNFDKSGVNEVSISKSNSFAKTLTQSDANNGGGFSVPRHIYRGTPRRHLLTTGWSNFVSRKRLVAGDSVVFLRAENGELCIGVRRAKTGLGVGAEVAAYGWNSGGRDFLGVGERGESVIEAVDLASCGRPFEVVYYPRASTPEFVVRASVVRDAMRVRWCGGMRFKMAFETEDSSRISWFMGTISSVRVDDPIRWPNSPWRLLQVAWDEPDLLQNVKRVSPWLVELVSNIPAIHLSPLSVPRKRPRLPELSGYPVSMPTFFSNNPLSPLCCFSDNNISYSGIQGARHARILLPSSNFHYNKPQPFDFKPLVDYTSPSQKTENFEESNEAKKSPLFLLFGQPILTEEQIIASNLSDENRENVGDVSNGSVSGVIQNFPLEASSDGEFSRFEEQKLELGVETTHCKVFTEPEDVGRTLDLSILTSYEELYGKSESVFCMERSETSNNVVCSDSSGTTKHTGDECRVD